MGLTAAQLLDEFATVAGTGARSGDAYRVSALRYLNQAFRTIAYAYPWDERRGDQIVTTVAPYSTGTVAVSQAGTTVTCTGSTLTSGMVGRKFALSQGGPFYRIATVNTGAGTFTISAFAEATVTASAFVIYQDEYDLDAATHSVEQGVAFRDRWTGPFVMYDQRTFDAANFTGWTTGAPIAGCVCTSTTVGTPRIRISPVPDAIYRINLRYLKAWVSLTDGSNTYTTQGLPEDIEELALDRALRWLPKIEGSRRVMTDDQWWTALRRVWAMHSKSRYRIGPRRGTYGGQGTFGGIIVNTGGL